MSWEQRKKIALKTIEIVLASMNEADAAGDMKAFFTLLTILQRESNILCRRK